MKAGTSPACMSSTRSGHVAGEVVVELHVRRRVLEVEEVVRGDSWVLAIDGPPVVSEAPVDLGGDGLGIGADLGVGVR